MIAPALNCSSVLFRGAAAENGFDSQNDFARTKRLRYVIVGAEFKSDDAIDFFGFGRQHHDRNLSRRRIGLENFANFEAGHFWQHEIEDDQVRLFLARFLPAGGAVRCAWRRRTRQLCASSGVRRSTTSRSSSTMRIRLLDALSMRARDLRQATSLRPATAGFTPAFSFNAWVNSCRLETICGRLGQHRAGQFLRIIGPALRHFRQRHHDRQRIVYRCLISLNFFCNWASSSGTGRDLIHS